MKLGMNVFVSDKNDNIIARHSFIAANKERLHDKVESFEWAIKLYGDGYTVMHTPICFISEETVYECKK